MGNALITRRGGGKPEGLYAWKKYEIGSEAKEANERISQLPFQFSGGSSVVLNGEIHILGTSYGSNNTQHYKWNGSSWTNASTLPYKFYYGAAVILNGEIHIFGGTGSSYNKNHYKWNGKSWVSVSTLPYDFYLGSAVVFNGEIHILGGSNGYGTSHYKWNGSSWINASTLPYDFSGGSAIVFNNEIHILGSYPSDYRRAHYKWDGSTWSSVSTIPYDFYYCSAVVFDDALHVIGGVPSDYQRNHYKFDGSSWISVGTLSYPFYQGCAVVFDNAIHILGSTANTTEYYMNHYLIMHYVTVYTFLDYIVSDKETAYPDGGEKGEYYYERVTELNPQMFGCTKMAVDTYTPTANTQMGSVTLNHSLGEIPRFVIITSNNLESYIAGRYTMTLKIHFISNWHGTTLTQFSCGALKNSDNARSDYSANNSNITLSSNTLKCSIDYSPGTFYLYAGDTYTIYTFA